MYQHFINVVLNASDRTWMCSISAIELWLHFATYLLVNSVYACS